MIQMGESRKAMLGKSHYNLRSLKHFLRLYLIIELFWMDSHHKAKLIILVKLGLRQKISAVHKRKSVAFTVIFGCIFITQDHERILLMA